MGRRGYSGYHGRTTARDVLRAIVCLLSVLLILLGVGLMLGQRYIVYTDDGVRLELPFFQRQETPPADQSISLDIVQRPEGRPAPGFAILTPKIGVTQERLAQLAAAFPPAGY